MIKRIISGVLALILILGLLAAAGPVVFAASEMSSSEEIVSFIKNMEGFSPNAFWDVSQWSIGYGTKSSPGATITEEEADAALRKELEEVDKALNEYADASGMSFSQTQFDALASFSYNCGTGWTKTSGRFRQALESGATGNDFLYAISLWANIGTSPSAGLLKRRMCEANIYLNGVYSADPGTYSYVILNPNGGTPGHSGEDEMQGYDTTVETQILADAPSKSGSVFGGWYTASVGGGYVSRLNAGTAGKTLYAQWGDEVTVTAQNADVVTVAGGSQVIGQVNNGQVLVVVQVMEASGKLWGRFSAGWLDLSATNYDQQSASVQVGDDKVVATGTVNCSGTLNIRAGAGTSYGLNGSLVKGQSVQIFEIKTVGTTRWGRIVNGWISLDHVLLDGSQEPEEDNSAEQPTDSSTNSSWVTDSEEDTSQPEEPEQTQPEETTPQEGKPGRVANARRVNVRKEPGFRGVVLRQLSTGDAVTVYEQTTSDGLTWGKIDGGYICMDYVQLDGEPAEQPEEEQPEQQPEQEQQPEPGAIGSGTVNSKTLLNVRSNAGISYPVVKTIAPGTRVSVYEKKWASGLEWLRIGTNQWICASYINWDAAQQTDTSQPPEPEQTTPSQQEEPIASGRVTANLLNVRNGAGTQYQRVKMLRMNETVNIYERKTVGDEQWGRIGKIQWVCMSYISLNTTAPGGSSPNTGQDDASSQEDGIPGVVNSVNGLVIRGGAGLSYGKVGELKHGTQVNVLEQKTVGAYTWGRIDRGWICLNYVDLQSEPQAQPESSSGSAWVY